MEVCDLLTLIDSYFDAERSEMTGMKEFRESNDEKTSSAGAHRSSSDESNQVRLLCGKTFSYNRGSIYLNTMNFLFNNFVKKSEMKN